MNPTILIQGHEIEVTDRLRDYATKKVSKLARHNPFIDEMQIELLHAPSARSATDRYVTQITVRGKGFTLRAEERSDDIRTATDSAVDKMQRQIERYRGKHFDGRRDGKTAAEVLAEPTPLEEESTGVISKRKTFELIPMDEAEAFEQMQMLGHDNFFIFFNAKTEKINVLYKRSDQTYGIIEPRIR